MMEPICTKSAPLWPPHVKWLKPTAGPTPKVLFMVSRVWGASTQIRPRDIVEIWQRMDLEFTEFVYMQSASERDRWESNIAGSRTGEKWAEAREKLAGDYDVRRIKNEIGFVAAKLPGA